MGHLNCDTSLNDSALERWATCCMTGPPSTLPVSVLVFSALLQRPHRRVVTPGTEQASRAAGLNSQFRLTRYPITLFHQEPRWKGLTVSRVAEEQASATRPWHLER